ncbi:AI-2E family transporter [Microvirga subterranea]|uniref:Putative PurR-regulated permease PerM n=1 Tax=Microvirga subterranea TaxID=186651 RepID=A0A370H7R3_9HYPH|nr:AI-2E family transporter [Microvirga subterranea]RDI52253.1 putative PurR-regulated permease PerM [Microvirga subterranea]
MELRKPPPEPIRLRERRVVRRPVRRPTPILISTTAWRLILLGLAALLALVLWAVPIVPAVALAGFAVALVLSFPVQLFTAAVPRGIAILLSFLILLAVLLLVAYILLPLIVSQAGALVAALPNLVQNLEQYLVRALRALDARDLLPDTPEAVAARLTEDFRNSLGAVANNVLGHTVGIIFGTFSWALTLFAVIFIAASLLANVRSFKAAYLTSVPGHYRHDALEFWDALGNALSRYLGGLGLVLAIQGILSALGLFLIGVPYALALGAWVSITAVIPYLGAWLGAIPALLVAFSISSTAAVLTGILFLAIQQLEGNVLTPRIQAQTIKVPSVLVFLGVLAGGSLAGITGVLLAVPTLATVRVIFDFFRVRLRTE